MDGIHTTDWARTIYSPKVWYCDVSPHEYLEFKEKEELERHLHNEHSNELSFEQLERRLARNVLPSPREKGICPLCNQDILKIHQFHERLLVEDGSPPPMVLDQKVRSDKGSRVRFEDVEDVSSADEETFNDLVDDFASLNAKERSNLILGKVSKHIAGHLKSLAFLSIRYLSHDAATGEGDSGKAAFGADDADTEVSNRADKATERILDDFPEAVDGGLEFDDIQADRTDIEEGEHFEGAMGGYEEDFAIIPERETENDDSLEEKKLQTQKATAEQRLSNEEKECRELFRLATGRKYERDKDQVGARAEGTCRWFLRHKNFGEWLGWDSGVLLVTADPGCGKSVLAKYLIDEALPRWQTVCYFFFQDQDQNKLYQALRALLHQLFCYQPSLLRHAISEYAKYRRGLIESTSSLWSILENAAQDLVTGPLIIVLDAMDECAESDMESFVQLLNHPSRNKMKFLLTGRSHAHLETAFLEPVNSFICLHISGEKKSNTVLEDVHHLIGYRVEQLAIDRKLSRQIKHHLAERLLSIRNPTYLWVYLVFEFMRAINMEDAPEEAATTIASLPKNTYEVYEQMLSKSYDRLVMRKALSIILAAERPLTLLEMNVAMNIDKQSNSIDDIKLKKVEALESRFRNLFGFFVSIRRGKIGLFHHTARTFLLAESSQPPTAPLEFHWKHSIAKSYAHSILAGLCVVYLNLFNSKATPLPDTNGEASHSIDSYAFLNYSARKWGVHFHEANIDRDDSDIVPLALKICKLDSRAYAVWSENFQSCYNESPLLKAAEDGHEAFARLLLDQGAHLESKDEWGYTPLSMAAYNGHVEVAKLLLSRGADPDLMDQRGNTPLSWAAERG
ncbi:hypothetical protein F4680DRAFT_148998 [Xylaria scruposa]|nr:hypothetical protein F4680DRAFT_148998 [Xylaria scruposa]